MTKLEQELASKIDSSIAKEIVKDYEQVKTRYGLLDFKSCAQAAGTFCEGVMKALLYLRDKAVTSKMGLKFDAAFNDIMNKTPTPTDTESEYAYRLIPPVLKSIYDIRNKKRGSHARGEELLQMDMQVVATSADWVVASLLFVSHRISEENAFQMMADLMTRNTPLMWKFGKNKVLIVKRITAKEAIAVVVSCLGQKANLSDTKDILLRRWSRRTVERALKDAASDLLVFLDSTSMTLHLLPEGRVLADRIARIHIANI